MHSEYQLQLMEEYYKLKQDNPLLMFQPHPKQQLVHLSLAKTIWIYGGNRSGKTEINVVEFAKMLDGSHPHRWYKPRPTDEPILIWVTSESDDSQRDTLQKKLQRFIPHSWFTKITKRAEVWQIARLTVPNRRYGTLRVEITFKSYKDPIQTFESASVDGILSDEEPPEVIYDALKARLLDAKAWGNGWFQCALTPTEGKGWSVEKFGHAAQMGTLPKDVAVFEFSTYDNAHNLGGVESVQELAMSYKEHERDARIYGKITAKHGMVLHNYKDLPFPHGNLVKPFKPDWSVFTPWESIDYGFSTISSVGFYAVNGLGEVYRYAEIYVKQHTIPQVKSLIYHHRKNFGYKYPMGTIIDPSTRRRESDGNSPELQYLDGKTINVWVGRGQEPTFAHTANLRKMVQMGKMKHSDYERQMKYYNSREGYIAYSIPVVMANNSREAGWDLFNECLLPDKRTQRPKFYVTEDCVNFRTEARTAKWNIGKDGMLAGKKGVTGDDHALDEARYILAHRPFHKPNFRGINDDMKETTRSVRKY